MRLVAAFLLLAAALTGPVRAAGDGYNPAWSAWFRSLTLYDAERQTYISCCGDGDAVFADEWKATAAGIEATITDNRGHDWAKIGTKIVIPKKLEVADKGNPTGHLVLFLRPYDLSPICVVIGGEMI